MVGKSAYRNLATILHHANKSVCSESEEEPNLLTYEDSRVPVGKDDSERDPPADPQRNESMGEVKHESKVVLKCDEILLPSSNSDDESAGGISDLTEEFLQIPVTSTLFKKAMEIYRDSLLKEHNQSEQRDAYDDLEHIATVQM
jgi:hypothetical protein